MSSTSILPLFNLLASHDIPTRIDASLSLITSLTSTSTSTSSTSTSTPTPDDQDTPYAIKRLVAGLASSNDAARQGFAVALTELLARLPSAEASEILPLVLSSSTPTLGADSKEERNLLFSRLLGLHAVLRSGILSRRTVEDDGEGFKEAVLALHALAWKKSWIRESAYWVLVESVKGLLDLEGKEAPAWKSEITKWIVQRLLNDSREKARGWGPEKVALVLIIQAGGVTADYATVLSPEFPSGNLLSRSSLTTLAQALKGNATPDADPSAKSAPKMGSNAVKTSKGASTTPGAPPHFVWSEIFDLYFPDEPRKVKPGQKDGLESRAKWSEVWRILVDQSLFAPASIPLKATGFSLLSLAVQKLPPAEVPTLFGEGVMRTFANHLRKSGDGEKTLNRVAEKLAASLVAFLTTNPTVSLPLLKALVAPPSGSHSFDHRTIEKIVFKLDPKGVKGWVKYLKDFILGEQTIVEEGEAIVEVTAEDEKALIARRMWAFDQLLHVARVGGGQKDDEVLAELLEFFAVLGWFEVRKSGKGARSYIPVPAFGESIQIACRSRFFSILTALSPAPWLSRALGLLDNLTADSKNFTPITTTEEEVLAERSHVREMYKKLDKVDDERSKTAKVLIEGVLLLSFDEGEDSVEALESIKDCLRALFPAVMPPSSPLLEDDQEMADEEEGEEPEAATVLVDLLLEMLHRPSAFVKNIAQTVFTGFADELGEQGMELIIEQIRPDEVAEEDDEEDATMVNEDGGFTKKKKAPAGETSDDSDSEASDDEDDSEDDVDVDEDFRNELLAALEASGVGEQFEANGDGEDESAEEELLDDDQMMALDDKLADIFKLQGGGKKGKKAERMDDLHYRLRVVDLLEALAKQRTPSPLLVLVVLPLFSIIRRPSTLETELQEKSLKLLRHIVAARKDVPVSPTPQLALDALAELHVISQTVDAAELATLCSQTSVFLVKAALASPAANESTSSAIAEIFGDSFETYLSKKNAKTRVQPALTLEFAKRSPVCAWLLFDRVVDLASGKGVTVNAFRRMQAFEVAHALLTSQAAVKTASSKANILAAIPPYQASLIDVLTNSISDPATTMDASRLKELFKLSLAAARITTSMSDAATTKKLWKGEEFSPLLVSIKESERFKGAVAVQNLLKQLLGVLGQDKAVVGNGAGPKRKRDEVVTPVEAKSKKSKKESKVEAVETPAEAEVEVELEEDAELEENEVKVESKKGKKNKKSKKEKKSQIGV